MIEKVRNLFKGIKGIFKKSFDYFLFAMDGNGFIVSLQ